MPSINQLEKSLQDSNTPDTINYRKIKVKKSLSGGKIITKYYYNNRLIFER